MASLIEAGISNAVFAGILACMAYSASRLCQRPALAHVLWVLVLIKLVTPPLTTFPIGIELEPVELPFASSEQATSGWLSQHVSETSADGASSAYTLSQAWQALLPVAIMVWFVGSLGWLCVQLAHIVRFRGILKSARVAPQPIQRQARALARELGLGHCPQVWLVAKPISPMLWAFGSRARLLFPQELLDRISYQSRSSLMVHELAHYRRGDHWVRVLQFVVTGVFWWHPVTWWARYEIEAAEEQCCDAWVVEQFPEAPRCYAEALLDTIDFLNDQPRYRVPAATGLGEVPLLRKRLTQIMLGVAPHTLSAPLRAAAAVTAAALLPIGPTLFGPGDMPLATVMSAPLHDADTPSDSPSRVAAVEPPRPLIENVWATAATPNGRYAILATEDDRVFLEDTIDGGLADLTRYRITAVAFSPDGRLLATGSSDGSVKLWSAASGRMLVTFAGHRGEVRSVVFSPNGAQLITGSRDGAVEFWSLEDQQHLASLPLKRSRTDCVRISPDGRQLAVASGSWRQSAPGRVTLWDAATLELLGQIECDTAVGAITFDRDNLLLTAEWNGRVKLWNTASREPLNTGWADKDRVAAARFSPQSVSGLRRGNVTWDRLDAAAGVFTTSLIRVSITTAKDAHSQVDAAADRRL